MLLHLAGGSPELLADPGWRYIASVEDCHLQIWLAPISEMLILRTLAEPERLINTVHILRILPQLTHLSIA